MLRVRTTAGIAESATDVCALMGVLLRITVGLEAKEEELNTCAWTGGEAQHDDPVMGSVIIVWEALAASTLGAPIV